MKTLLLILCLAFCAFGQTAIVISEKTSLRGTSTNKGLVVDILAKNDTVEIVKQKGAWFLVQSLKYVGWVQGNDIKILSNNVVYVRPIVIPNGWALIAESEKTADGIQYFYQPSTVKTDILGFKKVWVRVIPYYPAKYNQKYKMPKNTAFFHQLFTAQCSEDRYSMESGVLYDEKEEIIKVSNSVGTTFYAPVIPGTVAENIFKKLCR